VHHIRYSADLLEAMLSEHPIGTTDAASIAQLYAEASECRHAASTAA